MELGSRAYILTFVVLFALSLGRFGRAAPTTDLSPHQLNQSAPAPADEIQAPENTSETWQISPAKLGPAPASPERIEPTRIVRSQTLNAAFGLWAGQLHEGQGTQVAPGVSITQTIQNTNPTETAYEYGADLTALSHVGFHWQYKSYCCLGENFEPYWSLGGAALYDGKQITVDLLRPGSYQMQAGGGFEDLFGQKRRWRLEGLVGLSTLGGSVVLRLGYAFDDLPTF